MARGVAFPSNAMQPSRTLRFAALPALLLAAQLRAAPPTPADTLLLEPETFAALGPWQRTGNTIQSSNMAATALAGFRVSEPGEYRVWTRSQDFPASQPGTRRFLIKIDEQPAARESGAHGREGWYWENVGAFTLAPGPHLIEIDDTARFYGRLEAILITRADFDPNAMSRSALDRFEVPPVQPARVDEGAAAGRVVPGPETDPLATLANERVTIRFLPARAADGAARIRREVVAAGSDAPATAGAEALLLLHRPEPDVSFDGYFPSWKTDALTEWDLDGRRLRRPADSRDPFAAATIDRLEPVSVRQASARSVEIGYRAASGLEAVARWTLPAGSRMARVEAAVTVPAAGCYSLAFGAGEPRSRDQVAAVQLPPLFQFRRVPDSPVMVTSSETPHPLALVESVDGVTTGVVADPSALGADWSSRTNAGAGFSLLDPSGRVKPWVFEPVLGGEGSARRRGDTLSAAWWVITERGPWTGAMREADTLVYGLSDYREPVTTSLTDQALNIIDLMKDDAALNWDPILKGPANIESPSTVTHAAPLMFLSAARLTRDAGFFERRAEPAMEYLLSRPGAHFALTAEGNLYVTEATARIAFDNVFYGSAVWQGLDDLTGGLNPWLRPRAQRDGGPLRPRNNSAEPTWSGLLALYRQDPDPALLDRVRREADSWIGRAFELNATTTRGLQPFYNVSFYPYWWDLLDLYQITHDERHLDAARRGAWQTVAGQWVTPPVPAGERTLHPGGRHEGSYLVWWKDDRRFRLGWPEMDLHSETRVPISLKIPEKTVPGWVVSQSGLGIEQPISYFTAANNMANIQLTSWAANLLRLSGETGDDYWRTFARNAVIGRGASYPGYYLSDYTDLAQDPDYPRTGPDLTYLYWHHVPVHLAMLVDYLFTDADVRTRGAVRFPYAKQQGYVWFSSRVYGGKPGRVFDDAECWPWLDRTKFRVDTPMVDFLGARGRERFHLVLLNQARGTVEAPVVIDPAALGIADGAKPLLRTAGGERELSASADGRYTVSLPKGAYAVLSWPAAPEDFWPRLAPVGAEPVTAKLGDAWGELQGVRIRSPFGKDALHVALTAAAGAGEATLEVDDGSGSPAVFHDGAYPYEFTLHALPLDRDIRFRLELRPENGASRLTDWFSLPGTPRRDD